MGWSGMILGVSVSGLISNQIYLVLFCLLGKGLPMFAIILIISLCCMVVFTMASIMLCRKTSQQGE